MALVAGDFVEVETDSTTSNATSYTTGSHVFIADTLYCICVLGFDAAFGTGEFPTVSGTGITFTEGDRDTVGTDITGTMLYAMPSSTTGSIALTIDFNGQTQTICSWAIIEVSNTLTSGTNGGDALIQFKSMTATSGTTGSMTLDGAIESGNGAASCWLTWANKAKVAGTNETEIGQDASGDKSYSQFNLAEDETLDITLAELSSVALFGFGFEIAAAAAAGTLYYYISTSATAPSISDLKDGTEATKFGNAASSAGINTFNVTGLVAGTTYYTYFIENNGVADSNILPSDEWMTLSADVTLGIALETDSALAISIAVNLGIAAETDVALPVGLAVNLGVSAETDTALPIGFEIALSVALETDSALPVKTAVNLALATETDLALPIGFEIALGVATENDLALPINLAVNLGIATETDFALPVAVNIGVASEIDTALPIVVAGTTRRIAITLKSFINDTITLKSEINDIITLKSVI